MFVRALREGTPPRRRSADAEFAPQAQADIDEAVSWLLDHGHSAAVAERLLTSVLEAAAALAR